jgi:Flp pilus assembly protein TadG
MVEFALIIPIFLLFVFGILDLGRAVYAYHTLNNAAREGARVAVVDQTLTRIQDRAAGRAVGLGVGLTDVKVDYRTATAPDVEDSCLANVGTEIPSPVTCTAIVLVELAFTAATPIISNIIGTINMAGESSMVVQFGCQDPSVLVPCPDTD